MFRTRAFLLSLCVIAFSLGATASDKPADLSSVPTSAQSAISAALGSDNSAFKIRQGQYALVADSAGMGYRFSTSGVAITSGAEHESLQLRGYGYGQTVRPAAPVAPQASRNRVEYKRPNLTEWYVNGPLGVEQGFSLNAAPGKSRGQLLTLAFALSGNLRPTLDASKKNLTLASRRGNPVVRYAGLTAIDADGEELRATLEVKSQQLLLHVDDHAAHYPIVIDPWIAKAQLSTSDEVYGFGLSVAMDSDTIVVGTPYYGSSAASSIRAAPMFSRRQAPVGNR